MSPDAAKEALSVAKAIQDGAAEAWLPPVESAPSRSHSVMDIVLVKNTRTYIEKVAHQINKTYDDACYDACAVMVRRLVETLIIEVFESKGAVSNIKLPTGVLMQLRQLIDQLLAEGWNIGRNTEKALPRLKDIGDRSAHDRYYNAMRRDIDNIKDDLRIVVQALLYIAKLK